MTINAIYKDNWFTKLFNKKIVIGYEILPNKEYHLRIKNKDDIGCCETFSFICGVDGFKNLNITEVMNEGT